jgi:hypothetical protein
MRIGPLSRFHGAYRRENAFRKSLEKKSAKSGGACIKPPNRSARPIWPLAQNPKASREAAAVACRRSAMAGGLDALKCAAVK